MLQTIPLIKKKKDFKTAEDLRATLYEFAGAAITKCHSLESQTTRTVFSHHSGGWESQVSASKGWLHSGASLLPLQMSVFSPCPDTVSLCVQPWCLSVCPNLLLLEGQQADRMGAHPQGLILTKLIF